MRLRFTFFHIPILSVCAVAMVAFLCATFRLALLSLRLWLVQLPKSKRFSSYQRCVCVSSCTYECQQHKNHQTIRLAQKRKLNSAIERKRKNGQTKSNVIIKYLSFRAFFQLPIFNSALLARAPYIEPLCAYLFLLFNDDLESVFRVHKTRWFFLFETAHHFHCSSSSSSSTVVHISF